MCEYQCDKAMTKNDTREVIWYHITAVKWYHITSGFELSNQIDCNNLVGPIRLFYFSWRLAPGVKFGGKNCFAVLSMASSRFVNVSDEDISHLEENENKNTARKTSQDVACIM